MGTGMGVYAAGNCVCLYDMVTAISFLWLKRWHAPAGRRIL